MQQESKEILETRVHKERLRERAELVDNIRIALSELFEMQPGNEGLEAVIYIKDPGSDTFAIYSKASRETTLSLVETLAQLNNAKLITFRAPPLEPNLPHT